MVDVVPASVYLRHSELVQGGNPVGQIAGTRYSKFALSPELQGYGFSVPTVSSPLNDPTISQASFIAQQNDSSPIFNQTVTDLYEKQNNYLNFQTGTSLDITG